MKLRRLLSCMMALLLVASLPVSAFADNWYLDDGDITVAASESGQAVFQGGLPIGIPDSAPVITQSDSSTPTSHTVTITTMGNATANVTLQDVNIDTSSTGKAAVEITGDGNVIIELDGNNTVQSGLHHAGVEKNTTGDSGKGKLTITDENGTAGSLKATGGENGAGIGGAYESSASNISISGGEVTATGGGPMVETGGDSLPPRAGGGAGIGGGTYGTGDNITVEKDAKVTAEGKGNAADIGNGHGHPDDLGSEYQNDPTKEQPDNVNVDGLYTTGSVNGVSGTKEPPKNNDNGQPSGSGSNGYIDYEINVDASTEYDYISVLLDSLFIRVTDQKGQNLSGEFVVKNDTFTITAASDSAIVSGDHDGLKGLKDHGVKQTVLETNCVNLTVSNEFLERATKNGEQFQLKADGTDIGLAITGEQNQENLNVRLTNRGPQQSIYAPLRIGIGGSSSDGSDGDTMLVTTSADSASLLVTAGSFQTLADLGFDRTALATGGLTSGFKNKDVMEKIDSEYNAKLDFTVAILETDGEQSHCVIKKDDYATDAIEITSISILQQAGKSLLD